MQQRPKMDRYPKPGRVGGRLIREIIGLLKNRKQALPISSHILIAVSGGADSVALAHNLIKYGRRVAQPEQLRLLHVNHGWRGKDSDEDARQVKRWGKEWGVPVTVIKLKPEHAPNAGDSWESAARDARKRIFEEQAQKYQSIVLTAHHADDLAETMLWRLLTGQAQTHGAGILIKQGVELRPLLKVRKNTLEAYCREEGLEWREDQTNHDGRFLRSKMRRELLPVVEKLFPRAVEHLVRIALELQEEEHALRRAVGSDTEALDQLFARAGVALRRPHYESLKRMAEVDSGTRHLHLSEGWRLCRDAESREHGERWVLEKTKPIPKS